MSQIYKNMNSTGKTYFFIGAVMELCGLVAILFGHLQTRIPILGVALLAYGIQFLATAQYDTRCNIANDTKGIPLEQSNKIAHEM